MQRKSNLTPRPRHLRWARGTALTITLVLAFAARAAAHDHGVLKLASKTFNAGDSIMVAGVKFARNDAVALALVGATGRVALADVPTDTAGTFRRRVLVPASVKAGQYRLVAEAVDGDEVASLDVVVSASATPVEGMAHVDAQRGTMQMGPTGAPLQLARARSVAVTGSVVLLIIACVAGGATLLRTPRANSMEDRS